MKKKYKSISDWENDLEKLKSNPNDKDLILAIVRRFKASEDNVQQEIKGYLYDSVMEHNPMYIIEKIKKENPNIYLLFKDKEDPYFRA